MNKRKAITLLRGQLLKLERQNPTGDWRAQTQGYIRAALGANSELYQRSRLWREYTAFPATASLEDLRRHSVEDRQRIISLVELCITTIVEQGVHREPKENWFSGYTNFRLVLVLFPILSAIAFGAYRLGIHMERGDVHRLFIEPPEGPGQHRTSG